MSSNSRRMVLAIGIDAAEPALVRQLIAEGYMRSLQSLLDRGQWLTVNSPANIGSGSVWPTMLTGKHPSQHGVYGEWCWQANTMSLSRYNGRGLEPFWKEFADEGMTVGILDVPFARLVGLEKGFEITEWGPHDCLEGQMQAGPNGIRQQIEQHDEHPLSVTRLDSSGPSAYDELAHVSTQCLRGIQLRGELSRDLLSRNSPQFAFIVFTEIHHSAHYLWHNVEPQNPIYSSNGFKNLQATKPTLKEIYTEVDRQIGELMKSIAADAGVVVFSLHGMRATHGIPAFLAPLLCEAGFAQLTQWGAGSWKDRGRTLLAAAKRSTPASLKKLYYRNVSPETAYRLAQTTMLPSYDWQRTRAFSLPSDQHGWVRINLCGREKLGIVEPNQYDQLCDEMETTLRGLLDDGGNLLVRDVIRTCATADEALMSRLPDLIVHWDTAAYRLPLKLKDHTLKIQPSGTKFTGQHSLEGFCLLSDKDIVPNQGFIKAAEIGPLIHRMITGERS